MKHGDLVTYKGKDIGRIKGESAGGTSWVVFRCGGNWSTFDKYTAESTPTRNLTAGWVLIGTKWRRKDPYNGEGLVEVISNVDDFGHVKCKHLEHAKHPGLNEGVEHIPVDHLIKFFYQV